MKSVLISIRPKWCELIASGEKTVEVRKTMPKIETPFKCYIYETQSNVHCSRENGKTALYFSGGKVIGEFVCDFTELITFSESKKGLEFEDYVSEILAKDALLTLQEAFDYSNGKPLYGWHISDLKIYDNPRELSKFRVEDKPAIKACKHRFRAGQPEYVARHGGWLQGGWGCMKTGEPEWCENCLTKPLTRPPQSWCYVEEKR